MMDTKGYSRQLKYISALAVVCALVWLYFNLGRAYVVLSDPPSVTEGREFVPVLIAGGCALLTVVLVVILGVFFYAQIKSLDDGQIFSKRCQSLLFVWAVLWPFYDVCASNMGYMVGRDSVHLISIEGSAVGVAVIIFTFALLYKIARQVAEENQLTI